MWPHGSADTPPVCNDCVQENIQSSTTVPVCKSDLWPFDLDIGVRVASTVATFIANFVTLGLWVLELFAMYATYGQTDRWTDKSNTHCPLSYSRGHNKVKVSGFYTITFFLLQWLRQTHVRSMHSTTGVCVCWLASDGTNLFRTMMYGG